MFVGVTLIHASPREVRILSTALIQFDQQPATAVAIGKRQSSLVLFSLRGLILYSEVLEVNDRGEQWQPYLQKYYRRSYQHVSYDQGQKQEHGKETMKSIGTSGDCWNPTTLKVMSTFFRNL